MGLPPPMAHRQSFASGTVAPPDFQLPEDLAGPSPLALSPAPAGGRDAF